MRIRGTQMPDCKYCENSVLNEDSLPVCKIGQSKDKCKKYRYNIFRYEPLNNVSITKFSKEDFEI